MNRFHSKYHRSNHHTLINATNPDAGHDPIASHDYPFQGDFVVNGNIKTIIYNYESFSGSTLNLPISSNQIHLKTNAGASAISNITGGLSGVLYTVTNDSTNSITINNNSSTIYVRGGVNLTLGSYQSCNIKIASPTKYSVW
jgi:hypothetical protein